jgi:uncharacterized membrane protein YgdD (TMEM256/DUF423 family)
MGELRPAASRARRGFAATGAFFCAAAIGLGAYGAHAAEPVARERIATACLYLLVHGVALAVLAPRQQGRIELAALIAWSSGGLLFSGSLLLAALYQVRPALAPVGGMLLIAAWLLQAIAALRR